MAKWQGSIQRRTDVGKQVELGTVRVVPQAQAWVLRWRFFGLSSMIIWNRPHAVAVEQNGRTFELPIPDITRRVVWACWAAAALFALIGLLRPFGSRK